MRIKSILLTFMAVLAFTACNNEVLSPSTEIDEAEVMEKGYLVLNLVNPTTTRTYGDATDIGTAKESEINSLMVVFTDATGTIVSTEEPTNANGVTVKFKVTLGTYDVYALINKPDDVIVTVGGKIEQVIEVAAVAEATSGYKSSSFFMVNKRNSNAENAGVTTIINSTHSISNPAHVFIYVDRVACKIVDNTATPDVTNLKSATGGLIFDVEVMGFAVLNVNREFNLIQTWSDNNAGGLTLEEDVLSTPLYPGGASDLVANQYFYNIGRYATIEKDDKDSIISIVDKTVDEDFFGKDPVYTTENRPTIIGNGTEISAGRGETTGVIYKVKAKKDENTDLGTFYTYKNEFYEDIAAIQALQEFDNHTLVSFEISELRALGIRVYEDGVMYYTYFIRDPNVEYQHKGKNYYGVFRNSTYKLAINSISSLGDDIPGGAVVDPSEPGDLGNPPIETEETYIQVSVVVNKWILNILSIDF